MCRNPMVVCSKVKGSERLKDPSPMVDRWAAGVETREAEVDLSVRKGAQ